MPEDSPETGWPGGWRDVLAPDVLKNYVGQHIAIVNKRVIASGATYEQVYKLVRELYPDEVPYIALIHNI